MKLRVKLLDNHELTVEEVDTDIDGNVVYQIVQDAGGELILSCDIQPELSTSCIDEFIDDVAFQDKNSFRKNFDITDYYSKLNYFLSKYNPRYHYSPKTTLFYDAIKITSGIGINHEFPPISYNEYCQATNSHLPLFFNFINTIRDIRSSKEFRTRFNKWRDNLGRSYKSASTYIDWLFERYSRLLVVRLDLGFRKTNDPGHEEVTIDQAQKYLSRFLNAKRSNKIFNDLVGYVWKLEYGELKGYHFHLLIFLDGSETQRDIYRGLLMGQYWISLTKGAGVFYISNFKKRYFERRRRLGIGMISHFEKDKRENLDSILRYFFKPDQYLREKPAKRTRAWGKGEISSLDRPRRGRPRKKRDIDT
jgi:hypothetical protein